MRPASGDLRRRRDGRRRRIRRARRRILRDGLRRVRRRIRRRYSREEGERSHRSKTVAAEKIRRSTRSKRRPARRSIRRHTAPHHFDARAPSGSGRIHPDDLRTRIRKRRDRNTSRPCRTEPRSCEVRAAAGLRRVPLCRTVQFDRREAGVGEHRFGLSNILRLRVFVVLVHRASRRNQRQQNRSREVSR